MASKTVGTSLPEHRSSPSPVPTGHDPRRWGVLGAYMLMGIATQMLWITFSPLGSCGTPVLCPSANNTALLTASYPAAFVLISIPVGYLIDRKGFRQALLLGGTLLSLSGVARPFAPSFPALLLLQVVGALGQPFVLNSVSKVVRGWFPESEIAVATGLGTLSIYIGLALGLGATPVIAQMVGVRPMLEIYGVLALGALGIFALVGRESPKAGTDQEATTGATVLGVLRQRDIMLLSFLFFLGIGTFNALATWVVPMLGARGVPSDLAGPLGGVLIVGGIVGALVISAFADRRRTLRGPLLLALAASSLLWASLGVLSGVLAEAAGLFVLGFFFLATLPLALELSARAVPRASEGVANSVVWEFSQIGGFAFIFVFQVVAGSDWTLSFFLAAGLCALMLAAGTLLRSR